MVSGNAKNNASLGLPEPKKVLNSTIILLFSLNGFFFSSFVITLYHSLSIKNNKKIQHKTKNASNNLQQSSYFEADEDFLNMLELTDEE